MYCACKLNTMYFLHIFNKTHVYIKVQTLKALINNLVNYYYNIVKLIQFNL